MRTIAVAIVVFSFGSINAAPLRIAGTTTNVSSDGLWREVSAANVSLTAADVQALRAPAALAETPLERLFVLDTAALDQRLGKVPIQPLLGASGSRRHQAIQSPYLSNSQSSPMPSR